MADGFPLPGAEEDGTPASTGQQGCCKHLLVALLERVQVEKCTKIWIPPTAADLNPSSMKTEMLCLPVVREEARVLCGLASKGKVIFVNKMRGNL